MTIPRCPTCRTPLADPAGPACHACGQDLAWVRAEIARLTAPSSTWVNGRLDGYEPANPDAHRRSAPLMPAVERRWSREADPRRGRLLTFPRDVFADD